MTGPIPSPAPSTACRKARTFNLNANTFKISYVGGTGNDIVLTVISAAKTWTGAVSNLWSNPGNWQGGVPGPGDPLVFPSGAANLANKDDLTDGVVFRSILFSGSNYVISGSAIGLTDGISSTTAPNTIFNDIQVTAPQTMGGAICCGPLNLNGSIDLGAEPPDLRLPGQRRGPDPRNRRTGHRGRGHPLRTPTPTPDRRRSRSGARSTACSRAAR